MIDRTEPEREPSKELSVRRAMHEALFFLQREQSQAELHEDADLLRTMPRKDYPEAHQVMSDWLEAHGRDMQHGITIANVGYEVDPPTDHPFIQELEERTPPEGRIYYGKDLTVEFLAEDTALELSKRLYESSYYGFAPITVTTRAILLTERGSPPMKETVVLKYNIFPEHDDIRLNIVLQPWVDFESPEESRFVEEGAAEGLLKEQLEIVPGTLEEHFAQLEPLGARRTMVGGSYRDISLTVSQIEKFNKLLREFNEGDIS